MLTHLLGELGDGLVGLAVEQVGQLALAHLFVLPAQFHAVSLTHTILKNLNK